MEERTEYQVLAPDSVAWFIQAALVADRAGNVHTRDLALAEAQRIAAERRLVEQPAPEGSRVLCYDVAHECNGVRLAEIERRLEELGRQVGLLQAEHVTPADVQSDRDRIKGLETLMVRRTEQIDHLWARINEIDAKFTAAALMFKKFEVRHGHATNP